MAGHRSGNHWPFSRISSVCQREEREDVTYEYTGQIEDVPPYREAKGRGNRRAGGLEENAMRVNRLGSIFKCMRGEIFPVFNNGLIFE